MRVFMYREEVRQQTQKSTRNIERDIARSSKKESREEDKKLPKIRKIMREKQWKGSSMKREELVMWKKTL